MCLLKDAKTCQWGNIENLAPMKSSDDILKIFLKNFKKPSFEKCSLITATLN